jgi:WD40 repeat protein
MCEIAQQLELSSFVVCVAWSPEGEKIISASYTESADKLVIWDTTTGEKIAVLDESQAVTYVAWSARGDRIVSAAGCIGNYGQLSMWDPHSRNKIWQKRSHTNYISCLSWNPASSDRFVSASYDKTLIIWDATSGEPVTELAEHTEWVQSAAWSPAGQLIASSDGPASTGQCSPDTPGVVIVWDALTARKVAKLSGHALAVAAVAWAPAADRLATASYDQTVAVWDAATWRPLATLAGLASAALCVAWSPDGARIAAGAADGGLLVWDAAAAGAPPAPLAGHADAAASVAWAPGGDRIASGGHDQAVIVRRGGRGRALAAAMATHPRLGAASPLAALDCGLAELLLRRVPYDWA